MKILKVPSSAGGLENPGTEKAPDEIEKQLKNIWLSEDFKKKTFEFSVLDFNEEDKQGFVKRLKESHAGIFLGGDHSLSYYFFKANLDINSGLVIFDAHPDTFESFKFPTYEDWLFHLIKDKLVKPENVILIGLRNFHEKEMQFLKENKIKFIAMKQLFNGLEDSCDSVMEMARSFNKFYLSIDIDVLDPAFAPGVGYPEPGGFASRELIYFIQRLKLLKNLSKVDIVEVNPDSDINSITSKLAARLIYELA